ncbi:hypothetical protein [Chryseobacterium sp. MFBS3-17]|uniref:hypothetical protein n=1 Tax=Chryseobacterium sp. MFBS3-17 TaxID=2886689 RepID=UPI001D0DF821|nr:hypothetical protein [Chryseobacterium sp. MFBS3-17]MCC2591675.1 hypothetical protein [Chryseobacterium sp. MFBS3-17]
MIKEIVVPAMIAASGFLAKSAYEIYLGVRNKKIEILENRLQKFYWPILIRVEKDNAIWQSILSKKEKNDSFKFRLADTIEKNYVLKNHDEILDIIMNYTHLAEPDQLLTDVIRKYIRHITIYKAIRELGEEETFPLELDAEWPQELYPLLKERTEQYQTELNRKKMFKLF